MNTYLELMKDILDNGVDSDDRTGVGTRSIFGAQMRFDLSKGFPAMTTKKLAWKAVVSELLWFIKGSTQVDDLRAILHGEENRHNRELKTIWDDNADNQGAALGYDLGELGPVYGSQWRNWNKYEIKRTQDQVVHSGGAVTNFDAKYTHSTVDQLQNIINRIQDNPTCRRLILTAWNPAEIDKMALPPCHCFSQFRVLDNKLHCQVYIRSNDMFLGAPFNIASYALLTHMVAHVTGYEVGDLVYTMGDAHIYKNHIEQVKEQLAREPYDLPTLGLSPGIENIDEFTMGDIVLLDYNCHPAIKAEMAI